MRILGLLVLLLVILALALGGALLARPSAFETYPVLGSWALQWQGLTPAKTPQEALDKFQMLVKKRDYKHAVMYCSGPYADELRSGAEAGTDLARGIDELNQALDAAKLKAEKVKILLAYLEPLPAEIKIKKLEHKEGESQATAALDFIVGGEDFSPSSKLEVERNWKCDQLMLLTLLPGTEGKQWNGSFDLKREGSGSEEGWKVVLPVFPRLRQTVSRLKDRPGPGRRCPKIMAQNDRKRELRELKRAIKKAGNRKRRQTLKRDLRDNPEEAAHTEFEFGRDSSTGLNGIDKDTTRRQDEEE
jgi:hypothetical protein